MISKLKTRGRVDGVALERSSVVRPLPALAEDLGSVPSAHVELHSHLELLIPRHNVSL